MTITSQPDLYYDPFDTEIDKDPHPVWRRMRDEAPLWLNEKHGFYTLSRFDDVEKGLVDWDTYRSGKGSTLEMIKAGIEMPPGMILMEDPPIHDAHRGLMSRVFTPKKMNALEPKVREFCARSLDPLVVAGRFDFVVDLGAQMPMRTIGMLLGIPEQDQEAIRDRLDAGLKIEEGEEYVPTTDFAGMEMFADMSTGGRRTPPTTS
jgi:cytochrome P450